MKNLKKPPKVEKKAKKKNHEIKKKIETNLENFKKFVKSSKFINLFQSMLKKITKVSNSSGKIKESYSRKC